MKVLGFAGNSNSGPCDLVRVEGFRGEGSFPRIAADHALDAPLPVLDLGDAAKIVAFVADRLPLP